MSAACVIVDVMVSVAVTVEVAVIVDVVWMLGSMHFHMCPI